MPFFYDVTSACNVFFLVARLVCMLQGQCFAWFIYFILLVCLFPDTKSIVQTRTLCTTQIDKNRQNRTCTTAFEQAESQGYRLSYQNVLQGRWRQNQKITDTYLTLLFANQWHWCNTTAEQDVNS